MATPFQFSLLSPLGRALEGAVEAVVVPAADGDMGILAHHAPILAAVRPGVTQVTQNGQTTFWVTGEGLVEVSLDTTHLLVDTAEKADSLPAARARVLEHLKETGGAAP